MKNFLNKALLHYRYGGRWKLILPSAGSVKKKKRKSSAIASEKLSCDREICFKESFRTKEGKIFHLTLKMGTVLSFSPRERRPIYSTQHSSFGGNSTGTLSNSNSADFQLNNYSYEQLNNVKNRENTKPPNLQPVPNNNANNNNNLGGHHHHHHQSHQQQLQHGGSLVLLGQTHINITNNGNNITTIANNNGNSDTARILSEKNALEKNLKKHSLFINALSWKRLAASHNKKKQLDNNKNKAANLPTAAFRKYIVCTIIQFNEKEKWGLRWKEVKNEGISFIKILNLSFVYLECDWS